MDTDAVKERLNLHLKRKLQPLDDASADEIGTCPSSVIVPNNAFQLYKSQPQRHSQPSTPSVVAKPNKRSPRKGTTARITRRQLNSSTESINSAPSSTQSTPTVTPVCRSMTATPVASNLLVDQPLCGSGPDGDASGFEVPDKQPDLLWTILNEKRMSMMQDPEVIDFLQTIACIRCAPSDVKL